MTTNFKDVLDFHIKFGLLTPDVPTHLTQRKLGERYDFMQEELDEFTGCARVHDMAGMADALIDLVYVAMGTAVQMGLPWQDLWDEVQRANMAKVRGATSRGHSVDVTKPPGWIGPEHIFALLRAGYRPEDFMAVGGVVDDAKCLDDQEAVHG